MQTFLEFVTRGQGMSQGIPADLQNWAKQCLRRLDASERQLLDSYSGKGSQTINAFLRRNTNWDMVQDLNLSHAKTLDAHRRMMRGATTVINRIFEKCRTPRPLSVFRGIDKRDIPNANYPASTLATRLTGQERVFNGYSSTTLMPWMAATFAEDEFHNWPVLLEFLVPRGYPAIPIFGLAGALKEYEVLLPHRVQGRIVSVTLPDDDTAPQRSRAFPHLTEMTLQVH